MISLAFDTSNKITVVALFNDDEMIDNFIGRQLESSSVEILPAIERIISSNKLTIDDIDQIIVAVGPGSFTGLRVGVTVAKVLSQAKKIPLKKVSSLMSVSMELNGLQSRAVFFDARNDNVFAGIYSQNGQVILEDQHISFDKFRELAQENNAELIDGLSQELSGKGLFLASKNTKTLDEYQVSQLVPNYLRETQAEMNWQTENKTTSKVFEDGFVQEI